MQKRNDYIKTYHKFIIISWMIIVSLLFPFFLINSSFVQTRITKYAVKYLSEKLKTKIIIKKVNFSLLKGVIIKGIYIEDVQKDTLLYIKKLSLIPENLKFSGERFPLQEVKIDSLICNLKENAAGVLNLQFVIDAFSSTEQDTSSKDFMLSCNNFELSNSSFQYQKYNPEKTASAMNFDDLKISKFNFSVSDLNIHNEDIFLKINKISFNEKCGFELHDMSANTANINGKNIFLNNLKLITGNSDLYLDSLNFKYDSWNSFNNFISDIEIETTIKDSTEFCLIDLVYFVPELKGYNQNIGLGGSLFGTVDNLKTKSFSISYGKNSQLIINSKIKNLPEFDELKFDIKINKLASCHDDIANITYPGDSAEQKIQLPKELSGMGKFISSGHIRGSSDNFV